MDTDDDDAATLRERVRELEATVAQQQDTIEQLMPSRRAILAGGAGLVGGAALTGQASAQSAAGQVGTSSEPVDVEAATVSATDVTTDSLNTADINLGQNLIKTDRFTLSDDSAISFDDYEESQWFYLMGQASDDGHAEGVLIYQSVNLGAATDNVDTISNTELTGTTGTDGQVSLSMDNTVLYIENRVGREADYRLIRIQGSPDQ